MFILDGVRIAIFHVNEQFFAIDDRCPHAGASLACGYLNGETISCRIHHWHYCLRDGRRLDDRSDPHHARCFQLRVVDQNVQVVIDATENSQSFGSSQ
jgi:nitrite reductase (NADH) small subunit/3-phenylpropionate/trans-cinnamate dioxygenase ferredoxin subunit